MAPALRIFATAARTSSIVNNTSRRFVGPRAATSSAATSPKSAAESVVVTCHRAYSSSSSSNGDERVKLVFDHHEPPSKTSTTERSRRDSPIIFMHGLFGSKKNNRSVCKVLARDLKRHVYAIDLRNHGESPHSPRHDYLAMADDVAGFIDEHGLKSPTLIGHSMGAKTAMTLALSQPSLIRDLVSVDNAPIDAAISRDFATYVRGMKRVDEARVAKQSEADAILADYEKDLGIRQFLLGNLSRHAVGEGDDKKTVVKFRVPLDVLGKALDHMGDFPFRDPDAARFEGPALFVRGTKSKYVADEAIPIIGRFFPRFRMADIEAGHWVISEKPADFLKAVTEFLTSKE